MDLKQSAQFGQHDALDGLRGLSALLVILGHHGLISHGYLGLSILNALSGFLVTRRLVDELEFSGGIDFQKFYSQRARRILPAFLLSVGFVRVVFNTSGLWSTLLFVNNWVLALNGNLGELTPTWSLSQETQFYFIWPLILKFLWTRRPPSQALINQVVCLTAFLAIFIPMGVNPSWANWGYFNPFARFGEILTGCVAALAWHYKSDFCISSFFAWIILPLQYWIAMRVDFPMPFRLFLVCFLTNVMILYLVQHANSYLAKLLSVGSLRYVGKISYSLFLFGEPVRHVVTRYVLRASLVTPLSLICAVLVAIVSWTYVESRFSLKRTDELNNVTLVTKEFTKPLNGNWNIQNKPYQKVASLASEFTAQELLSSWQQKALTVISSLSILTILFSMILSTKLTVLIIAKTGIICACVLNLVSSLYQLLLTACSTTQQNVHGTISDSELPSYSVLVPLYQEGKVFPSLVKALSALKYPLGKLQILLLIEKTDEETIWALGNVSLGPQFEVVFIDPGIPQTKPRACNVGLPFVRGELCTIYDAEDRPDPDQLVQAATLFSKYPSNVACVQARLQFWNPFTNWLTQSFAAEYALRYNFSLSGLDRLHFPIPLGGSSNHFRTSLLCEIGAWDEWNLTEDADLGIRIARLGLEVLSLNSTTLEEANSELGNWIRQRSRWIKGHIQTWLIHNRDPVRLWHELGAFRFFACQLSLGLPAMTYLVNPFLYAIAVVWFIGGHDIVEPIFSSNVSAINTVSFAIGTFLAIGQLMLACANGRIPGAVLACLTAPAYWLLMSIAAYKAIIQLAQPSRRHYWELTRHGLVGEN